MRVNIKKGKWEHILCVACNAKNEDEDEGDQAWMVNIGIFRQNNDRRDRWIIRNIRACDGVDRNFESIKMDPLVLRKKMIHKPT